jgi:hypothetical protein
VEVRLEELVEAMREAADEGVWALLDVAEARLLVEAALHST